MKYDDIYYIAIKTPPRAIFAFADECEEETDEIYAFGPVEIKNTLTMELAKPIPRKLALSDYHEAGQPVFSKKMADIVKDGFLGINQLFYAELVHKGITYPDFYVFKPNIELEIMHKGRSSFTYESEMYFVDKLSLDENKLDKMEKEQRWIIEPKEEPGHILYHEELVEKFREAEVTGVRFVKVSNWNTGSAFD
ncbi:hypothetical protein [Bacterioplanoides sp.]|uniref:hypothetical protein n=1 Tax=Bacterioplanoides sp. TaxID=2066072 RepID=UPI003B002AC0